MGMAGAGTVFVVGTLLPIPWYRRYVQINYNNVILIFTFFFNVFSVNSSCHTMTEPNVASLAAHTSPLTPTLIPPQKHVSYGSIIQKLINSSYLG